MRGRLSLCGVLACSLGCTADSSVGTDKTLYAGTWTGGQSDRSTRSGDISFTVTSGVLAGRLAGNSGSAETLTGTVSSTGVVAAVAPSAPNGCAVVLAGQVTAAPSGTSVATGTYTLTQSLTCNTNTGTWTATRPAP